MNNTTLIGRLTRDPELRYTQSGKAVCSFTLAVNRMYSKDEADFIKIIVWDKQGENADKYLSKGSLVGINGSIQTGSFNDKDGKKVYTTDIVARQVEFLDTKNTKQNEHQVEFEEIDDAEVPF